MRILFIAPQPFYEDRGTPIAVHETLVALSNLGFTVDVATYPMGIGVKIRNVHFFRTSNLFRYKSVLIGFSFRKIFLDLCLLITVLRQTIKNEYDCVHAIEESAVIALFCKVLFGLPVIYDMHSSFPDQIFSKIKPVFFICKTLAYQFERLLVKHSDCVIGSKGLAPFVMSIEPGKAVWECSFDGGRHSRSRLRNEQLSGRLGLTGRPVVGYFGTFAAYQGVEMLIEVAVMVCAEIPEIAFILVGGTETEISHLKRLVLKHNLVNIIQLIPRCPREEVTDYLSLSDILVLPRPSGHNAPLKVYEYLKSGKPIIATDIAAHRAVLSEETAIMVQPKATAIANGILFALRNKNYIKKILHAATLASRKLESKPLKMTLEEAYRFVLKRKKSEK